MVDGILSSYSVGVAPPCGLCGGSGGIGNRIHVSAPGFIGYAHGPCHGVYSLLIDRLLAGEPLEAKAPAGVLPAIRRKVEAQAGVILELLGRGTR